MMEMKKYELVRKDEIVLILLALVFFAPFILGATMTALADNEFLILFGVSIMVLGTMGSAMTIPTIWHNYICSKQCSKV